jgi:hypothetical protein
MNFLSNTEQVNIEIKPRRGGEGMCVVNAAGTMTSIQP